MGEGLIIFMKLESFTNDCKEVQVIHGGVMVTVNTWSNLEGCTFIVHEEKGLGHRVSGSMTWEELDSLLVALTAVRTA